MRKLDFRLIVGALLVLAGVLFLMDQLLGLKGIADLVWALVFAVGGGAFLYWFAIDRKQWWALIPGFVLLGLAVVIAIESLPLGNTGNIAGGLFLAFIGLGFLAIYLVKRDFWWALIPAGTLFTLGLVAGLSDTAGGNLSGGILFLGMAGTFTLLYFLPTAQGPQKWSIFPAIILGLMGLLILLETVSDLSIVLPAAMVALGAFFLWRALVPGKKA